MMRLSAVVLLLVAVLTVTTLGWQQKPRRVCRLSMTTESTPQWSRTNAVAQAVRTATGVMLPASLMLLNAAESKAYGPVEEQQKKPKAPKGPKQLETDLGIQFFELKKGEGPYPGPGDFVVINYIGYLPDGTIFDELHAQKALSFKFGQKQVIPGLESVIEMMQPGGEVTTVIPSKFAYGAKGVCVQGQSGNECLIQPNTNLKYFIKLKRVGAGYN